MKYVIYDGCDEIIVCAKKDENKVIKEYFDDALGRDINDYDRTVQKNPPCIVSCIRKVW